jgi:pilus assembly protein CpaB
VAAIALSPARAIRSPRHLDLRLVVGVFLGLVAMAGSVSFWVASSESRAVLVATRDLPAGATINASDLAVARVRVDDAMYQAALPAATLDDVAGKQLAKPALAHQMLVRAQLSTRPALEAGQLAITVPIRPDTAVGGRIQAGDTVRVLATINKGKPETRTSVVLPRALVYEIGHGERLTVVNSSGPDGDRRTGPASWLTLVVNPDQAVALSEARWNGELDVALLPPAAP